MGPNDKYVLRDGTKGQNDWHLVGQELKSFKNTKIPKIFHYMTYDEIKLAALLQVSSFVKPINSGNRHNRGVANHGQPQDSEAVYVGVVGARLKKAGVMEAEEMIVDTKNPDAEKSPICELFQRFYKSRMGNESESNKFLDLPKGKNFNALIYRERISISAETFLLEANERGRLKDSGVHVVVVGLGLGVWKISDVQVILDTFM